MSRYKPPSPGPLFDKPDAPKGPKDPHPEMPNHDGSTYDAARDKVRLNKQTQAVFDAIRDGRWRTLAELSQQAEAPEASVSARLRDLRKPKFGGHIIERQRTDGGLWSYRLRVAQR